MSVTPLLWPEMWNLFRKKNKTGGIQDPATIYGIKTWYVHALKYFGCIRWPCGNDRLGKRTCNQGRKLNLCWWTLMLFCWKCPFDNSVCLSRDSLMKQPMVDIYPALSLTSFQTKSREEFLDPEPPKYQTSRNTVFTLQNHFKSCTCIFHGPFIMLWYIGLNVDIP